MDKQEAFDYIQTTVLAEQVRTINRRATNPTDAQHIMKLHNALWTLKQELHLEKEQYK